MTGSVGRGAHEAKEQYKQAFRQMIALLYRTFLALRNGRVGIHARHRKVSVKRDSRYRKDMGGCLFRCTIDWRTSFLTAANVQV